MDLVDASCIVDQIIASLDRAEDSRQVEAVFSLYGIDDRAERVNLLRKCMELINAVYHIGGDELSPEHEYNEELGIFLCGAWRRMPPQTHFVVGANYNRPWLYDKR